LPVSKLARITRIIDRALELFYAAEAIEYIESAIELILTIVGVLDGITNLLRLRELPSELAVVRSRVENIRPELNGTQNELRRILNSYRRLGCSDVFGDTPMA
jgi:hypothetical protein